MMDCISNNMDPEQPEAPVQKDAKIAGKDVVEDKLVLDGVWEAKCDAMGRNMKTDWDHNAQLVCDVVAPLTLPDLNTLAPERSNAKNTLILMS